MVPERTILLCLLCLISIAIGQYQDILEILGCEDISCGEACDTTWLRHTPPSEETTSTQPSPPTTTVTAEQTNAPSTATTTTTPPPTTTKGKPDDCPDPSYHVKVYELASARSKVHFWTTEALKEEKKEKELVDYLTSKLAFVPSGPRDATACIIQHDKYAEFERKKSDCKELKECTVPVCRKQMWISGRWVWELFAGATMDVRCDGEAETLIGYAMKTYDCCGANSPMYELTRDRAKDLPDRFYTPDEIEKNKWSTVDSVVVPGKFCNTKDIPFFVWVNNAFKQPKCPLAHMAPLVRTWSGDSNRKNHYFFMLNDLSHYRNIPLAAQHYRVEFTWHTGCAVRKEAEQIEAFKKECGEANFMACMQPLCNNGWTDKRNGNQVYRLQTGDINNKEHPCAGIIHVGYIATTQGCCGATTRLYTLIRDRRNPWLPGYHHPVTDNEVRQTIASEWSVENTKFSEMFVWPTS